MKYIVILFVVVILVRIDVILNLFDKTSLKYENSKANSAPTIIATPQTELVPIDNDLSLKTTPKKTFFSMLEDFRSAPESEIRDRIVETLKSSPTMFNEILDRDLEASIFRLRGQIVQKNKVTQGLVLEIMKSLKGENLEMAKRFLSYSIDADFVDFISFYSKTPDLNCILITYMGDNLPDEEKFNELSERFKVIEAYIASDKADLKEYAQRCHLVLKLMVDRLGVATAPSADVPATAPEPLDPNLTPAPGTVP